MVEAGGNGFWLDARGHVVGDICRDGDVTVLWDVGAGSGAMTSRLAEYGVEVISVEPLPEGALQIAAMGGEVFCASLDELRLPSGSVEAVGLFDVIEHIEEPGALLEEVNRILSPGGQVIATVPAFQWLWSREDEVLGHFRRYSKKSLNAEIRDAGFEVVSSNYVFASLVPLAALLRTLPYRLGRKQRQADDEVLTRTAARLKPSGLTDRIALSILRLESRISRFVSLPFGLSIVIRAKAG